MRMCRVCLSTEKHMLPLDETFIIHYNLLTNLNITLLDGMPQYFCQKCLDTVKYFIEFREKCIASETTLREIIYCDVKAENKTAEVVEIDKNPIKYDNVNLLAIKSEIKEENDNTIFEDFDISFEDYDEDIKNLTFKEEEDVKPKKGKRKYKKHKIKSSQLIENLTNDIEDQWLCGVCPKKFEDNKDLKSHLDTHKTDRICYFCREQQNSLSQLLAHRLQHVPIKQNKCHICDKRFRSSLYLEHHYRNVHIEQDERQLSCNICPTKCDTPKKFRSHTAQCHSAAKYICDLCSKTFRSKTNLKSHIKFHNENKAYVCDMCGFSCKHTGGLKDHKIRRHTPKRVYCKNCHRPFPSQADHDRHKCQQKSIICPVCGKQLFGKRLSRHMLVHTDVRKFECTRCPAKYKSKSALNIHLDKHDGNRTQQCEFCPAKFYSPTVLIKHRRIHTGEKPYVCKVCNKGFTGNNNLKVHMKVHGENLIVKKNSEQEEFTNVNK